MKSETKKIGEPTIKQLGEREEKGAVLILARKFDDQTTKEIKKRAEKILKKKVALEFDKEIIGGFIIKDENQLIDASVKSFLNKSKEILWRLMKT